MAYKFADCTLDVERHHFMRGDEVIQLEPQVFDMLCLLAENPQRLISKDQMVDRVWGGRIVSEATISSRISAARTAVGDTGKDQRIIKTIPRLGIELAVPVELDTNEKPQPPRPEVANQKVKFATSRDGTKIAYATSGTGPKIMRAGHFLTHLEKEWSSIVWRPYLMELGQSHTVIRYDLRATGLSDRNATDLSLQAAADDMLAVADASGMDRFPIIAASQSVAIALHFAANHPDRVSKLVLYGGFVQGRNVRGDANQEASMLVEMMRQGWGKKGSAFMRAFAMLYCPDGTQEEIEDLMEMQLASATPDTAIRSRIALDNYDAMEWLEKIQAPTLVMHARNDALQPVEQSQIIAAGIPDAEFVALDSNNHVYLHSDPVWRTFVDQTLSFLSDDRV